MTSELAGKTALVTGAGSGIGRACARVLAEAGAKVHVVDRDAETAVQVAEEIGGTEHVVDLADPIAPGSLPSEVDILVNNAGLQHREPLLDVSLADWNRVLTTDLTSAFLVGRAVARNMLDRGQGKIVNVCSVQTDLARPSIAAYTAAKGGLRNLTRAMTAEWAAGGLQINGIAPGYIHTEMTQALVDDPAFNSWILGRTPAARWGTVDDLVGPAVFLSSRAADYVNGQVLFIDGGMTVVV
jgi:gluconate 5-dehydrogenase